MVAQMRIDQAGLGAGVADVARTDGLDTGALVTLTSLGTGGTHLFELEWVPPEDTTAVASLSVTGDPRVFTFSPDTMSFGEYRIKLTEDAGLVTETLKRLVFGIRYPTSNLLLPALNTVADPTASLLNAGADVIAKSENNATDFPDPVLNSINYAGWWRSMRELFVSVEAFVAGGGGEINLGANVGAGTGLVFRNKTGVTLNLKSLLQGTRITVTDNADDITIATDAELNTGANVGAGAGLMFRGKTAEQFDFRSITGTGGIVASVNVDVVEIDGSGITSGEVNDGANVGSGADTFRNKTALVLNFRGIEGINGLGSVVNADNIDVGAITGTRDYNNQDLTDAKTVTFEGTGPLDNSPSGAAVTIDFADAQQQTVTLTAAAPALTIDPPPGPANGLVLYVVQDATGGRLPTFSSNVRWSNNGIVPTFTADPNAVDILHFVYDGTNMDGFFNENFA